MQKITSLHFPETIAQYSGFRQLLLFFDSMTQLLPAEDSFQSENHLVTAGMLEQYAPLPFGDDLAKFKRLIQDIQRHSPDFYGSSFSSLSASNTLQVDESSVLNLIAQMNPKDETRANAQRAEALLQARLLLKLAEISEIEEEELRENIQSINLKKSLLLSTLKGDEEEVGALLDALAEANISSESPGRFKQRLKAWTALLLADPKAPNWLVTSGPNDAFYLLKDAVETKTKPEHLFTIPLAGAISGLEDDQEYSTFLADFQNKTKACREILFSHLSKAAETGVFQKNKTVTEALEVWEQAVQALPAHDTNKLEFYLFKMPFSDLLIEGLGLKNVAPQETSMQNTVFAVLK